MKVFRELRDETGCQRMVGYLSISDENGARCVLDADQRHMNRSGRLHGGISVTLLDVACGLAASASIDPVALPPFLTLSLNTQFIAPGRPGLMTARGMIVGGGRSTLFVEGRLEHEDGTLIATGAGVFRKAPPGGAGDA